MSDYTVVARLIANVSEFTSGMQLAGRSISDFEAKTGTRMGQVGQAISGVGKGMTVAFTAPLAAIGAASINTFSTFEQQMNRVRAISGATGGDFEALEKQAISLGASSVFSATEVAQAQENMASAGLEAKDILSSMEGVMALAAVSGGDMALAGEAAAAALNQFGLDASQASHVADVYARAAADTNAETADMAEAMRYAGPVMGALGTSFEETAAAIGIMSNSGIKGSQAGTTLRTAMQRLSAPTKVASQAMEQLGISAYDSNGQMKPLSQLLPHLQDKLSGLSEEQRNHALETLFGKESLSGMLALLNTAPGEFDNLVNSLENSTGAAQEMADVMNSGTAGAIENLKGALESAGIAIGRVLAPYVNQLANFISNLVEKFLNLDEGTQRTIVKIMMFVAALGPALVIIGKIITVMSKVAMIGKTVAGAFGLLKAAAVGVATALGTITAPVWLVIAAIAALVAGIVYLWKTNETFRNGVIAVWEAIKSAFMTAIEAILGVLQKFGTFLGELLTLIAQGDWAGAWEHVKTAAVNVWNAIVDFVSNTWEKIKSLVQAGAQALPGILSAVGSFLSSTWQGIWNALVTIVGFVWDTIKSVVSAAWNAIPGILSSIGSILATVWSDIWNGIKQLASDIWAGITEVITTAVNAIGPLITAGMALVQTAWDTAWEFLSSGIAIIWETIKTAVTTGVEGIKTAVTTGLELLQTAWDTFWSGLGEMISSFLDPIVETVTTWVENIKNAFQPVAEFIGNPFQKGSEIIGGAIETGKGWVGSGMDWIAQKVGWGGGEVSAQTSAMATNVQTNLSSVPNAVPYFDQLNTGAVGAVNSMDGSVSGVLANITSTANSEGQAIENTKTFYENLRQLSVGSAQDMNTEIVQSFARLRSRVTDIFGEMVTNTQTKMNEMARVMSSAATATFNAGVNAGRGFYNGLASMSGSIISLAQSIANSVSATIRSALSIHSPSRVMEKLGMYTGQGLEYGMADKVRDIANVAGQMASAAVPDIGIGDPLATAGQVMGNGNARMFDGGYGSREIKPIEITLVLGRKEFRAHVADIEEVRQSELRLRTEY